MLRYALLGILCVCVSSASSNSKIASDTKEWRDIPLFLLHGANGTGEWLSGINVHGNLADDKRKKALVEEYNRAANSQNEDIALKFTQLVKKYGYPVEEYEVKTDDGYLLKLFRIPYGVKSPQVLGVKRPVAFLMHGLVDSSDDWILMGPKKSLGYLLADAGYDVWLGNARGNTHSKKHVTKNPKNFDFWQFSWDEIGRFDLPAMIDFALAKSGAKDLYYAGHSQGTTSFFVMCSMRPEYNKKIKLMVALAPIAWMSNMVSPMIRLASPAAPAMDWMASVLGVGEFLPNNQLLTVAGGHLCKDKAITQHVCANSIFIICGFDVEQMNMTMLPVIMGHSPSGSSVKQFLHYGQGVVSKEFRRYDHGAVGNLMNYGKISPPKYDLKKITAPVSLFYSKNDWLSHPTDVKILEKHLGNVVDAFEVQNQKFNHMDYMWAVDVDKYVNNRVLDMFKKY